MSDDYEVGYGKPPKKSQFKSGQSGNPKGRSKGSKNLKTDLLEELQEQVLVKEGGKGKAVTKQRAMIKSLMARAVHGDVRAVSLLLTMFLKLAPDDADGVEAVDLTEADLAILEEFKQSALKSAKTKEKSSDK